MKTAYVVSGYRTAVGKAPRGKFKFTRPDDLAVEVVKKMISDFPQLDTSRINDVIVGNATPEAEQGLNIGRMISLMGLDTDKVPGMTVNRYCSSGLQTIALASYQIMAGAADCIIAGGVETMSPIPFGGWRIVPNAAVSQTQPDWYWGMGLTAEAVAKQFNVTREEQDKFALASHEKALDAIKNGRFKDDIVPVQVNEVYLDQDEKRQERSYVVDTDEGPRAGSTLEALGRLRPVFAQGGTVTAGNSSQTSDGAAFVMVMSEEMVKELNVEPIARLIDFTVVGLEPRIMGMGPMHAIPQSLKNAGMKLDQLEQIELNEAFASQAVACVKELGVNPDIVNVNGGAIALGHPLGCTGAKLSVQLFNEMRRRKQKYGAVSMCVGTGQGACGIFELLN
ncbi:MAG TPA: acetyl-CoA C-acyltransferase [Flavobacteriales bacterium]|nr:acetyl-CoA C-acyltransferase [Crocinitomicaceae bacterium]HAE31447.1 acetyl-CoA C-acyltransferase [Flavobacteriales bacterium]|tara:strand:+ start:673 stop:1854 length:1182 start_codon:yes stop_codon:yes gene_type:complete